MPPPVEVVRWSEVEDVEGTRPSELAPIVVMLKPVVLLRVRTGAGAKLDRLPSDEE